MEISEKRNQANKCMQQGEFNKALYLLKELCNDGEIDSGLLYMIGQCYRYLDNYQESIKYLEKALINSNDPSIKLALGIAYQLNEQYETSLTVLEDLILNNQEWNSLDLAFNSFALTLKKIGQFERAEKNYKQSLKIFLFNRMMELDNSIHNTKLEIMPTQHNLWFDFVMESANIFSTTFENVDSITFPENQDEKYGGLFWIIEKTNGKNVLMFLPNFFAILRYIISIDPGYFNTVGNISSVLKELKKDGEANKYLSEAQVLFEEYSSRK